MYKYAFLLELESEHKLTKEELIEAMADFKFRLEGYTIEPLPHIKNVSLRFNDNLASTNEHVKEK